MAVTTRSNNSDNVQSQAASARAAASGTLWSFGLKLLSFAATQWTLRTLNPVALGKASIQLELLLSTTLFCAREGFRLALTKPGQDFQVAWLSIPVATIISMVALLIHLRLASFDRDDSGDYRMAGVLYCIASWVESWAEPGVLWSLRNFKIANKVKAEGVATLVKTLSLVLLLPLLPADYPITAFGIAQLLYAMTFVLLLYVSTRPPPWNKSLSFQSSALYLVVVFTFQGLFKHALTEADKIVLTSVSDHYHQGVYAMGSAYGGMAARLLLQPLEENARLLWSRMPTPQSYTALIHLVLHIGLLFATVGVNYTSLLLKVLAGRTWGSNEEASLVLSVFCVYTAFLAWNGMTEAFVYAVASSSSQVGTLGVAHFIVGGIFMCTAPILVSRYGTVGLVVANCIAMGVRTSYSIFFTCKYFCSQDKKSITVSSMARRLLRDMFPPLTVLLAYGGAFVATRASMMRMREYETLHAEDGTRREWMLRAGLHVIIGLVSVLLVAASTLRFEKDFRISLRSMFRDKRE